MANKGADQNMGQILQQKPRISATEFSAKFKSKREIYHFLTIDVKAYLPSYENLTIYFLRDLVAGAKRCMFEQEL